MISLNGKTIESHFKWKNPSVALSESEKISVFFSFKRENSSTVFLSIFSFNKKWKVHLTEINLLY